MVVALAARAIAVEAAEELVKKLVKNFFKRDLAPNLKSMHRSVSKFQVPTVSISGGDQFYAVSKALKAAGQTEMRKELHREMGKAAKDIIPKTRASARSTLPSSGGLADAVARAPQRVQVRTGRDTAGVRLVVAKRAGSGARAANAGTIRHPVFGNREVFVDQRVPPGWFDEAVRREAPAARRAAEKALKKVLDDIARKGSI